MDGLGLYDDLETCGQYSGYVWSDWTTRTVQPMHINEALQPNMMLTLPSSHLTSVLTLHRALAKDKGSYASILSCAVPFPDPTEVVKMEPSVDI